MRCTSAVLGAGGGRASQTHTAHAGTIRIAPLYLQAAALSLVELDFPWLRLLLESVALLDQLFDFAF